ncbi:MAG: histidine phosphatase family protein [Oceanospirillaceae bacterium]|nr:histidine phosphatase family protein [Oceanospirillaceae bacterium]
MPIDLLRHGKTTAGSAYIGSTDVALTETGVEQMQYSVDQALANGQRWDLIVSSPLMRCANFAQTLATELGLDLQVERYLAEYHFGDWEGQTALQVMDKYPGKLEAFWQDPVNNVPRNGEDLIAFSLRVDQLIDTLNNQYADKQLLLICHGGVMRYLLSKADQQPINAMLNYPVEHGQLVRLSK